jgi:integrase
MGRSARAAARGGETTSGDGASGLIDELPAVLYVSDLARLLRVSEKALRQRVARGQVPTPFRSGKALAWTRELVVSWLRDCGRSAGPSAMMKIKVRPYANDNTRFQLDIRFMHPIHTAQEVRRRMLAPPGLDEMHARLWGEGQVPALVRESMQGSSVEVAATPSPPPVARPKKKREEEPRPQVRASQTLKAFYELRFEPEYVQLQKPGTQVAYDSIFRNHIHPALGKLPLTAIDDDRLIGFRAQLRKAVQPSTANMMLGKLVKILRYARRVRAIGEVPAVERLVQPRRRQKRVYSEEELARLLAAARGQGTEELLVCLLALDVGLRVSEICALEWDDVDLQEGVVTVQNNTYRGVKQTPKGTIGKVALTAGLRQALVDQRAAGLAGPLVLQRRSKHTRWQHAPHTPHSIGARLNKVQRAAGLEETGPHFLRHTALTRLAQLGASIYVVQAVARHSRLQTTQTYLHMQQVGLAREAAQILDRATPAFGKVLANLANPISDRA